MTRVASLLPLALAACATRADKPPPPATVVMPVAARPTTALDLRGRWTVTALSGRPVTGLWLEIGGEGLARITQQGNAIFVGSPQPTTRTFLGCNWWNRSGWTREGDRLVFGREMSRRTEMGCDAARAAIDAEAYAIVTRPMTMAFLPPDRLSLSNTSGTLDLVRAAPDTR
jgi:hypothetical protein